MFEINYSLGDIRNSDLGEGIVCFGEGSGGKGEGKWGKRGGEVGVKGEGSGECLPPAHPLKCAFGACAESESEQSVDPPLCYLLTIFTASISDRQA